MPTARAVGLALSIGLILGAAAVGGAWLWNRPVPASPATMHLTVELPPTVHPIEVGVSRAFRDLVFTGYRDGRRRLFHRPVDRTEVRELPGTEGASTPFFSPDGGRLGFFADGALKTMRIDGSLPQVLCEAAGGSAGASWSEGWIHFAPLGPGGLWRVPDGGGPPERLTAPDREAGEVAHGWPAAIPGNRGILFTVVGSRSGSRIVALPPGDRTWRALLPATGAARLDGGRVLVVQEGRLSAAPIDLDTLTLDGPPKPLGPSVWTSTLEFGGLGLAAFDATGDGGLAFLEPAAVSERRLVWVDRQGRTEAMASTAGLFETPRLSPDGELVALVRREGVLTRSVSILERRTGATSPLVANGADTRSPVWAPAGRLLAFASNRDGPQDLYLADLTDAKRISRLPGGSGDAQNPAGWSADGNHVLYYEVHPKTGRDIWRADLAGRRTPLVVSEAEERSPTASRDGRWLAYVSDETGTDEVYVALVADPASGRRVSAAGGTEPLWSPVGPELFYRHGDRMLLLDFAGATPVSGGAPILLFEGGFDRSPGGHTRNYDIDLDGRRLLMIQPPSPPSRLQVVLNWPARDQGLPDTGNGRAAAGQ